VGAHQPGPGARRRRRRRAAGAGGGGGLTDSPSRATKTVRHPDLLAYRSEFALLAQSTYLNTCSLGALSDRSRAQLDRFLGQWDGLGARAWYRHWLPEAAALREDYGALLGVPGSEIALAPNVSVALTTVASAIGQSHGRDRTRVITTALDFPTIGHQWLARAPLGVEVVTLPSHDGLTVPLEAFAAAIDERTAVVATSHVSFTTGAVQDVAGLARLAHDRGALLVVDAYQATGLIPTRLGADDGPDAYVSGTLKWLFGGPGNAFLWVRPALWERLTPTTTGWFSSARQFAFDGTSLEFAPDARRYELGTPAMPSTFIARGGLELVREIGVERLHERTIDLGSLTIALADARGLRVRAVRDGTRRGGIVAVEVSQPKPVVDGLSERGIIVDYRPGIVRLSPAFYNTEDEVAAVVSALADLVPTADRV
jgi:selenocysteine lyase/cysteine desulfurase